MSKKKLLEQLLRSKDISKQLNVTVNTIQKWRNGESLPSIENIRKISTISKESEASLFELFKPETHAAKVKRENHELNEILSNIFLYGEQDDVFELFTILPILHRLRGIITSMDNGAAFHFDTLYAEPYGDTLIFADESKNLIVIRRPDILSLKPIQAVNNVWIMDITASIPIFPSNESFIPDCQTIRLFVKKGDK